MEIYTIPALSDNYIFLLHDRRNNTAAVVDPAVASGVLNYLKKINAELVAIFNTHHHFDHVGGNKELMTHFPQVVVYGGEKDRGRIPGQQVYLKTGDRLEFAGRQAEILFIPGHTYGHIAYYFPPTDTETPGELFCGDTLFAGGCGRLFEGTPADMVNSLSKIRALPDNTRVWCAHEYTLNNLQFALTIDKNNLDLQQRFSQVKEDRLQHRATIPSILGVEKLTNPFLRWDVTDIQSSIGMKDSVRVFAKLRGMKDQF